MLRERIAAGGAAPADASAAPLTGAGGRGTGTRGGASRDAPGGGGGAASSRVVVAAVVPALQEELRGARGEASALQGRLAAAEEHVQAMKERAQKAGDHLYRSADSALFRFCAGPPPREWLTSRSGSSFQAKYPNGPRGSPTACKCGPLYAEELSFEFFFQAQHTLSLRRVGA